MQWAAAETDCPTIAGEARNSFAVPMSGFPSRLVVGEGCCVLAQTNHKARRASRSGPYLEAASGSAPFVTNSVQVLRGSKLVRLGAFPSTNEDFWRWAASVLGERDSSALKTESPLQPKCALGSLNVFFRLRKGAANPLAAEFATAVAVPQACVYALQYQEEIACAVTLRSPAILMRCI